jgi:Fic/DOC family protein
MKLTDTQIDEYLFRRWDGLLSRLAEGPPPEWSVPDYIREEVRRQGHNLSDPHDGGRRVEWMAFAWERARTLCAARKRPWLADVVELGRMVEPEKNASGIRLCGVRVGARACLPPHLVPRALENLVNSQLGPLAWYKEFETIHPFIDGNGRTGKILLNWLAGTLETPFFPPADLFGYPITNP